MVRPGPVPKGCFIGGSARACSCRYKCRSYRYGYRCTVEISSGTTSLDKATCDIALARAVFDPAIDNNGKPTTAVFKLPVNWLIPDKIPAVEAHAANLHAGYEAQIVADEEGMGVTCRTIARTGDAPDPCANFKPGSRVGRPCIRDGRRVGSTAMLKNTSTITIDP
jgi:hypothetical protein